MGESTENGSSQRSKKDQDTQRLMSTDVEGRKDNKRQCDKEAICQELQFEEE